MLEMRDLGKEIQREHVVLRDALVEIRAELERLETEPGPAHHPGKLLGMLTMFRHHLWRHFELEEQGGFLVDRTEINPSTRRTIQTLLAEHRAMRTRLDGLIVALEQVECGSACLPDGFVSELKGFTAELQAHEHTEDQLVQELAYRDFGAGD